MALLGDMKIVDDENSFFMNETAERGVLVCISTGGSGVAMDQGVALVSATTSPSGKIPVGFLNDTVVDIDLTRQTLNPYQREVIKGGKVNIIKKGFVVTNKIQGTPTAGAAAYLYPTGMVGTAVHATGGLVASPVIGRFDSVKDQNGYAKVSFNL